MARALRVAVQMDKLATVGIAARATFALMLEAQARGHTGFRREAADGAHPRRAMESDFFTGAQTPACNPLAAQHLSASTVVAYPSGSIVFEGERR